MKTYFLGEVILGDVVKDKQDFILHSFRRGRVLPFNFLHSLFLVLHLLPALWCSCTDRCTSTLVAMVTRCIDHTRRR